MSACDRDLLTEYALGSLPTAERAAVVAHLVACAACTREVDELRDTLAGVALELAPVVPPPALRQRLLASVGRGRFDDFAERFATLFDLDVPRARELLDLVDQPAAWEPGPIAGTALIHFEAGPATVGADTGFVRVSPGVLFPWHHHHGQETNLVLQGVCEDSNGAVYRRGDQFGNPPGSAHEFRATGDGDYIFAVVVFGVDFDVERPAGG